jgi:hypothetical protein
MKTLIAHEFPEPTKLIDAAFADLQIAAGKDQAAKATLGDIAALARPWDPAQCPPTLRRELWIWLDAVVTWINRDYIWQADRIIPACWPAHPHIVHEIATVACRRLSAQASLLADQLEDWQRVILPTFLDRMTTRLGGSPCQPGHHKPWPAASRVTDFTSKTAVTSRQHSFAADTGHRPQAEPDASHPAQDNTDRSPTRTPLSAKETTP